MQNIVIIGAGGFGREVEEIISSINSAERTFNFLGYIDENPDALEGLQTDAKIIGDMSFLANMKQIKAVIAIGNPEIRNRISRTLKDLNVELQSLVSPASIVSQSASIGNGAILCANTFVSANAIIEENVVLNVYSSVGHDAVVHDHCVVSPYVAITGNVIIGDTSFIGTHSTVSPSVSIGRFTKISSGSVVSRDCLPGSLLSGNPAKGRVMFIPDSATTEGQQ